VDFFSNRKKLSEDNWKNKKCRQAVKDWHDASRTFNYQYMFEWLGRPIIQDPQDICAIQELIWRIKPDLIIETGIARGGSLMLSASILSILSYGEILKGKTPIERRVIGIDIDIRDYNRSEITNHPLAPMITLIEGSSISPEIVSELNECVKSYNNILVLLDSNHTRDHVYNELLLYSSFVSKGSAIFVLDTGIEYAPSYSFNVSRPWGPGNSPLTAVNDFLSSNEGIDFKKDLSIEKRLLLTCAPEGLLVRR